MTDPDHERFQELCDRETEDGFLDSRDEVELSELTHKLIMADLGE